MKSCVKTIIIILVMLVNNKILYADENNNKTTTKTINDLIQEVSTTTNIINDIKMPVKAENSTNSTENETTIESIEPVVLVKETIYFIHLNQLLTSILLIIVLIMIIYLTIIYFCNYKTCLCGKKRKLSNFFKKILKCCCSMKPNEEIERKSIKSVNINLFSFYFKYLFTYSVIILIFLIIRLTVYLFNDSNFLLKMLLLSPTNHNSSSFENESFLFSLSIFNFNHFTLNYLHLITNLPFISLLCFLNIQFLTQISSKNFFKKIKANYTFSFYYPRANSSRISNGKKFKKVCCKVLSRLFSLNNSILLAILVIYIVPVVLFFLLNFYLNSNINLLNYKFNQVLFISIVGSILILLLIISILSFIRIIGIYIKIRKFNSKNRSIESYKLIIKKPKFNDLVKMSNNTKYFYDTKYLTDSTEMDYLYANEYENGIEDDKDLINLYKRFFMILKKSLILLIISILFTVVYLFSDLTKLIINNFFGNYFKELVKSPIVQSLRLSVIILHIDSLKLSIEYLIYLFHILFIIAFLIGLVKFFHIFNKNIEAFSTDNVNNIGRKKNQKNAIDSNINFNENSHLIRKLSNSGAEMENKNNNFFKTNDFLNASNNNNNNDKSETLKVRNSFYDSNDDFNQPAIYSYSGQAKLGDNIDIENNNINNRKSTHYEQIQAVLNNEVSTFKHTKNSKNINKTNENQKKTTLEINTSDDPAYKVSILYPADETK